MSNEVKLFRLSGSAPAIDLHTGHNATLRPGLAVLSEDAHTHAMSELRGENERLNAALEALKAQQAEKLELAVWYGPMPESNGKTNWTALLHRKGERLYDGVVITLDRSEYPDRVRYEADRVRHLIGELAEEPCILNYDADKHSGYVKPVPVQQAEQNPVAYCVFTDNGSIRIWSSNSEAVGLKVMAEEGKPVTPLFTAPPTDDTGALVEALEELLYARTDKAETMATAALAAHKAGGVRHE